MTARHGRVLVVGDVVTDVLTVLPAPLAAGLALGTDTAAQVRLTAGGSAANTACWLAAAGTPVTLVAAVGDDPAGTERVAELAAAGVDCAVHRYPGAATGTVVVLADPTERTMFCDRGAGTLLSPADVDTALATAPDPLRPHVRHSPSGVAEEGPPATHLHLSGYPLLDPGSRPAARHALVAARAAGLTVSVDAASAGPLAAVGPDTFAGWVRGVDLLLANLDEARVLAGDGADTPAEMAARLTGLAARVVVKLGPDGALWADHDGVLHRPAVPVRVADPTGAGDAFAAGLLAAWLAGAAPDPALAAGTRLASQAVAAVGARPGPRSA